MVVFLTDAGMVERHEARPGLFPSTSLGMERMRRMLRHRSSKF